MCAWSRIYEISLANDADALSRREGRHLRSTLVRTPICAQHGGPLLDVSPRDRRLCVLPGWRMNVNVNTAAKKTIEKLKPAPGEGGHRLLPSRGSTPKKRCECQRRGVRLRCLLLQWWSL